MALQIEPSDRLTATNSQPKVGDVLEHGLVMKVETISVSDFIMFAISGGIPLHSYDEVLVDEEFAINEKDEDGVCEIVGGMVTLIWVNHI